MLSRLRLTVSSYLLLPGALKAFVTVHLLAVQVINVYTESIQPERASQDFTPIYSFINKYYF